MFTNGNIIFSQNISKCIIYSRRTVLPLVNDQLDTQILIHLLQSSTCTCFEQYLAHP